MAGKECNACKGTGVCDMCYGTGIVRKENTMEIVYDDKGNPKKCIHCEGTGRCMYCNGLGYRERIN